MQWEGREESSNVEDRRGMGRAGLAIGGGGVIIGLLAWALGINPGNFGQFFAGGPQQHRQASPEEEKLAHFTKVVFRDTEIIWDKIFRDDLKRTYQKPKLVLFSGEVKSACGRADAAVGPFYCPGDHKVFIDLTFYQDMARQLGAPGEFARAYVIAHEVGHHVQLLLGYSARVDDARRRFGPNSAEARRMSVRLELQADFLAGVWAHHADRTFNFLEPGDVDSALNAAFKIGDDYLQKKARGRVMPEQFTHGSSRQRVFWFNEGFRSGNVRRAAELFDRRYEDL